MSTPEQPVNPSLDAAISDAEQNITDRRSLRTSIALKSQRLIQQRRERENQARRQ